MPTVQAPAAPTIRQQAELAPGEAREHMRILAAYGGQYDNPQIQAMLDQTVDKLVAASERPDLRYQVTMLNSPAVNAFALPNGQLYVTRGLIALANDKSEVASVMAHEMAHVIARHAAIREDQARQAALVNRVATDLLSDPQLGALALAKSKIALANFSRAQEFEADGIGVGISARAGYDPYGAERFLTSMGHNAQLRTPRAIDPRAPDFLSSHPATPERVTNAVANARQYTGPGAGAREQGGVSRAPRRPGLWRGPERGLRARPQVPASQARLHLHRAGGLHARQLGAGGVRREGRRRAGAAARRGAGAGRADVAGLSHLRLDREHRGKERRGADGRGFPAATATANGDQWSFRLYVVRFGSEVYRVIFAAKKRTEAVDKSFRESIQSFRRMSVAEMAQAQPLRRQGGRGAGRRHGGQARAADGGGGPATPSGSGCSTGWATRTGCGRGTI